MGSVLPKNHLETAIAKQRAPIAVEAELDIVLKLCEDIDCELWGAEGSKEINARGRIVPLVSAAFRAYVAERVAEATAELRAAIIQRTIREDKILDEITNLKVQQAERVKGAWKEKEIAVASHVRGGAMDGCQCEPCVAVREILAERVKEAELHGRQKCDPIFKWLLGAEGDFAPRPEGAGRYWWRTELAKRIAELEAKP